MSRKIVDGFDITNQKLSGLTEEQYIKLIKHQGFKCCISGIEFKYKKDQQKFIDIHGKAPPIDHDHDSGYIRGILTQKVNFLVDQWEKNSYGKLPKPSELTEYQNNPPAFHAIGKVKHKQR